MKRISIIVFLLIMTHCCMSFAAGFPYTLNYQGMFTNKIGQPVNEPQDITFNLYTTPIGTELPFWTETLAKVPVSNGQLSITLGTVTPLDPSKFSGDTFLGIKVGTQAEMLPRQKMTSVPYAFNGIPQGGIIMWSGSTVPAGWALCDGSNGTPNLRDKFIVGSGGGYSVGAMGGEASHLLTAAESGLPVHNHPASSGGQSADHSHIENPSIWANVQGNRLWSGSGGNLWQNDVSIGGRANISTNGASNNHTHGITVSNSSSTNASSAHNNLPPYYALAFIMKL